MILKYLSIELGVEKLLVNWCSLLMLMITIVSQISKYHSNIFGKSEFIYNIDSHLVVIIDGYS